MPKNKIRTIVIDPFKRTVEETYIESDLLAYYKAINCSYIEGAYPEFLSNRKHFMYVDEEGMLKKDQKFFHIASGLQPYAGIALVLKYEGEGNDTGCTIPLKAIQDVVLFPPLTT